jgi:hypothetical protein
MNWPFVGGDAGRESKEQRFGYFVAFLHHHQWLGPVRASQTVSIGFKSFFTISMKRLTRIELGTMQALAKEKNWNDK